MFCTRCYRQYDPDHRFCPFDGQKLGESVSLDHITTKPTDSVGMVLGERYRLRGSIGQGAMARIYLAEDLATAQPVAIKLLESASLRAPRARERFFQEARASALVGHPNIVKILDTGTRKDGVPFLVMEYLFGESMGDWLRREPRMEAGIALPILQQAASGLGAAHAAGIVHRDVKPDNIFLVGQPGDPYAVKILDFGLAKVEAESGFTAVGTTVGTIPYMAPEQVVGEKADSRTDIYGLGIVMYRAFVGHLPFSHSDDAIVLAYQLIASPPPPTRTIPNFPRRLHAVITKALRKLPANRYPTMDTFVEDIERLIGTRSGSLLADAPIPIEPDRYVPKGPFPQTAATFFYRRLGIDPPTW
jgi:serine/threonine-protein kinase